MVRSPSDYDEEDFFDIQVRSKGSLVSASIDKELVIGSAQFSSDPEKVTSVLVNANQTCPAVPVKSKITVSRPLGSPASARDAVPDSKRTRVETDNYFADILQATKGTEPFWYYIIQRKGSNVIIDLVKFPTEQEAIEAARSALAKFSKAAITMVGSRRLPMS